VTTATPGADHDLSAPATDDRYPLGRSAREARRLIYQGDFQAVFTRRLLAEAGIGPGDRVLDVGSGAGDVALLAADLVGPGGAVVGIDVNPRVLAAARERAQAAGHANIAFVEGDVTVSAPEGPFDAVVGRLVLLYLPDPVATLRALAARLRRGGVLAFQEFDFGVDSLAQFPPTPLWQQVWGWLRAGFLRAGVDEHIGYRLHQLYCAAGLPAPSMHVAAAVGGGAEWGGYEYAALTVRSMLPHLTAAGIATAAEVAVDTLADRLRAETHGSGGVVKTPDLVSAWTTVA
jgi:ubiquinone/menaquinone biosynthesis C-methylase UbiE